VNDARRAGRRARWKDLQGTGYPSPRSILRTYPSPSTGVTQASLYPSQVKDLLQAEFPNRHTRAGRHQAALGYRPDGPSPANSAGKLNHQRPESTRKWPEHQPNTKPKEGTPGNGRLQKGPKPLPREPSRKLPGEYTIAYSAKAQGREPPHDQESPGSGTTRDRSTWEGACPPFAHAKGRSSGKTQAPLVMCTNMVWPRETCLSSISSLQGIRRGRSRSNSCSYLWPVSTPGRLLRLAYFYSWTAPNPGLLHLSILAPGLLLRLARSYP
jgi:hypothetical protein